MFSHNKQTKELEDKAKADEIYNSKYKNNLKIPEDESNRTINIPKTITNKLDIHNNDLFSKSLKHKSSRSHRELSKTSFGSFKDFKDNTPSNNNNNNKESTSHKFVESKKKK